MTSASLQVLQGNPRTRIDQNLLTFPGEGLIPRSDLYYSILDDGQSYYNAKNPIEGIVVGKLFDFVSDLTAERVFSLERVKIIPKPVMAYELGYSKTEKEILVSAHKLGLTRHKENFFGKEFFFDYPDFKNMDFGREKEVNLFDFYQIALRHKLPKEFSGKKICKDTNLHFFLEIPVDGQNKFEKVLKTYHVLLRNKGDKFLEATAHAFIPNHRWPAGDLCFFHVHNGFRPNPKNL